MSVKIKLLPCPFCGRKVDKAVYHDGLLTYYCRNCNFKLSFYNEPSSANWNRRSTVEEAVVVSPSTDNTNKGKCPKCGSDDIITFTADLDMCNKCGHQFPGS